MGQLITSLTVAIGLLGTSVATARMDSDSDATVAAHSFDPKNEDCKCLAPKVSEPASHQRAKDLRVVEYITNPNATGAPPPVGSTK